MGGNQSAPPEPTDVDYLQLSQVTHFSIEELRRLYQRYNGLSQTKKKDHLIDIHEFQAAIGMKSEGFARKIFAAFDTSGDSHVDFFEFAKTLSALSPKALVNEKANFCFKVYDIDRNGSISKAELKEILQFSLGERISVSVERSQIDDIAETTFARLDLNQDGAITYDEFLKEAKKNPMIMKCANIDIGGLVA